MAARVLGLIGGLLGLLVGWVSAMDGAGSVLFSGGGDPRLARLGLVTAALSLVAIGGAVLAGGRRSSCRVVASGLMLVAGIAPLVLSAVVGLYNQMVVVALSGILLIAGGVFEAARAAQPTRRGEGLC
jgi:hypothetical protein